jgi:glycosyltransferase involved in cell wall biosynthesis
VKLRVLLVSLFHPELVRGGAQQVAYELFQELRGRQDVACFLLASLDESHPSLFKSGARITGFDGRTDEYLFLSREYDHWWHKVGDPLLIEAFIEFLQTIRPDVVHFHHFMTFGIDLVSVVRRVLPGCRIVFTLHEFLAICAANGHMVRRTDGSLCDHASQVRCHQCFPDRSPEDFLLRKMWMMRHLSQVDRFACPSRYMIEHYVTWGLARDKIFHISNGQRSYAQGAYVQGSYVHGSHAHGASARTLPHANGTPQADGAMPRNRFGFFGQLHDTKGLHIILRAVSLLRADGLTGFHVEINGDNLRFASASVRAEIEAFLAAEQQLRPSDRLVSHNGSYHVDQLQQRMGRIDWCIVPSTWWEAFGLVISEAWMFGKPVICSDVGAMAERVKDNVDGLLFEMGDPRSLAAVMRRTMTEDGLWQRLHDAVPDPPSRAAMADGYLRLYGGGQAA